MPHVVDLFNGVEEVTFTTPSGDETARIETQGSLRLNGHITVGDGTKDNAVAVGLFSDDENWDYKTIGTSSFACVGIVRPGVNVKQAVAGGAYSVDTGCASISTVEQLEAQGGLGGDLTEGFVREGAHGQHLLLRTGGGDGADGFIILFDSAGQPCGVVAGELFDSGSWEKRILPGEQLMNVATLREAAEDSHEAECAPIAVLNGKGELLGWVDEYDHADTLMLYITDTPRPDNPPAR